MNKDGYYMHYNSSGDTTDPWVNYYEKWYNYCVGYDTLKPDPVVEKKRNYQAENNLVEEF